LKTVVYGVTVLNILASDVGWRSENVRLGRAVVGAEKTDYFISSRDELEI
jgi:hypothetical protein